MAMQQRMMRVDQSSLLAAMQQLEFFFSSRRRHTRYIGDWSSDVCSSDLRAARGLLPAHRRLALRLQRDLHLRLRSEERRVGKECRSLGSLDDGEKESVDGKRNDPAKVFKEGAPFRRAGVLWHSAHRAGA